MGCDQKQNREIHDLNVSIHAPAWGATCHAVQGDAGRAVSIHAPAWGATCVRPWPWPRTAVSIHAPAWGATKILQYPANRQRVSIHAPAWGATLARNWACLAARCFNPRTRVGCDHPRTASCSRRSLFQSTHPRGVRLSSCRGCAITKTCFNPRTRVGCDALAAFHRAVREGFQSTHPRGVRLVVVADGHALSHVSIHAPAWGATIPGILRDAARPCFNPRTRVGCDAMMPDTPCTRLLFQSTHPRGVRRRR